MKKCIICLALAALVLLSMAGCRGQAMNSELEDYQGKWFDVNSETVIELDGDRLTFTTPYYSEEYTVVFKTEGDTRCLANTDGRSEERRVGKEC